MILRILSSNSLASLPGSFLRLDAGNVESPNDPSRSLSLRGGNGSSCPEALIQGSMENTPNQVASVVPQARPGPARSLSGKPWFVD
jgi:hypothetical protein